MTTPIKKYPKGITSFSPALHDEIGLRWVADCKMTSTLKGLNRSARNGDATPLGLENIFVDGSPSCLATLG